MPFTYRQWTTNLWIDLSDHSQLKSRQCVFGLSFNKTVSTCDKTGKNRVVLSMCLGHSTPYFAFAFVSVFVFANVFAFVWCLSLWCFFFWPRAVYVVGPANSWFFLCFCLCLINVFLLMSWSLSFFQFQFRVTNVVGPANSWFCLLGPPLPDSLYDCILTQRITYAFFAQESSVIFSVHRFF